ncbi:MAG: right-handed parallel beta-helix repeat-containing protein, partial [Chloroflexota bacterium]|nr:right-handed parallel beta-helix repeat-containing protein [Chloroflexota bacterium]
LSITNGYAAGSGGGLYVYGASISISGCHVYSNTSGSLGSGLYLIGGKVTLTNNVIAHNTGGDYGYGVVIDMGHSALLSRNHIVHNSSGLRLWNNWATLVNNVIAGNEHNGLFISGGEVQAWHTTLANNGADGVSVMNSGQGGGHLVMTNTIIADSAVGVRVTDYGGRSSTVQLAATLWDNVTDTQIVEGGQITRTRDFDGDPAFVGSGDYHLTAVSPARNRGWPSDVQQDIDGEPRDPLPDLGADEFFDPDSIRQVYLPLVMR